MKRYKHHKVKAEMPETSSSHTREQKEHDLAYYIHDRVELMHQVFSVLKYKELKAMAPACVRNISVDDLQELCTEELLGISSKRLCAILDGAEPPSDTESSSQSATEQMETISLDSISSDEEILSEERNKKKKHKHRSRNSKSKSKHRKSSDVDNDEDIEKSKASRAGLTVLELLELQARARAIRAQLQQEQTTGPVKETVAANSTESTKSQSSEDEVEIKEEPAEVVEISSDEEKPKIEELEKSNPHSRSPEIQSKTVTKRVNDLVITVPQQKTQKIKLNRNKSTSQQTNTNTKVTNISDKENTDKSKETVNKVSQSVTKGTHIDTSKETCKGKDKNKEKFKKKKKKRLSNVSDNDEITLQLSDTEKMDLLEDLDRKNYDNVSSDTSSGSESDKDVPKKLNRKRTENRKLKDEINISERKTSREGKQSKDDSEETVGLKVDVSVENENAEDEKSQDIETDSIATKETESKETENSSIIEDGISQSTPQTDIEAVEGMKPDVESTETDTVQEDDSTIQNDDLTATTESAEVCNSSPSNVDEPASSEENIHEAESEKKNTENDLSEGEISERESSEVEAVDLKTEVVCISDEEEGKPKKKKKKKDKKSKKDKKNKKKDFRESSDQNYHELIECNKNPRITVLVPYGLEREVIINKTTNEHSTPLVHLKGINSSIEETKPPSSKPVPSALERSSSPRSANCSGLGKSASAKLSAVEIDLTTSEKSQDCSSIISVRSDPAENPSGVDNQTIGNESPNEIVEISDEVYELSDDSSNEDEIETQNVLSKEPTTAEIEALSAKIDEIERIDVITDEEIKEYEAKHQEAKEIAMSWKDRYLDSKKVKRVLNTSNILNALRKKNRQLKKRLEESKVENQEADNVVPTVDVVPTVENVQEEIKEPEIAEGSIEHYNTLEGSTKFVDPVKEPPITDTLKKDAKQLLKMYKKLLKYNDMSRKKDPTKKKKKKNKEKKDKECKDGVVNKESQ